MQRTSREAEPFALEITGLGPFGRRDRPSIIWAGVAGELSPAIDIHQRVDGILKQLKLTVDKRKFQPHVTLGRVRDPRTAAPLSALIASASGQHFGTVTCRRAVLMHSELGPAGARYSLLAEAPFARDRGQAGRAQSVLV